MSAVRRTIHGEARVSTSFLEGALHAIGVAPIPEERIKEYMETELRNAPPCTRIGSFLHRRNVCVQTFNRRMENVAFAMFCLPAMAGYSGIVLGIIFKEPLALGAGVLGILLAAAIWIFAYSSRGNVYGPAEWVRVEPGSFPGHLPEFVLEDLRTIRNHLPGVQFQIADLRQNKYSLDPVLFACYGDEQYAVRVWKYQEEIKLI